MASDEISILDVGHGNCALLLNKDTVVVVDSPLGTTLLDTLALQGLTRISHVFISHADADHIGGIVGLLSDGRFSVEKIYVNPDAQKTSDTWVDFRYAVADARVRTKLRVITELTTDTQMPSLGNLMLEVVAPTPELVLGGVGSKDLSDRNLSSNSLSAVLRIHRNGIPLLLLAADVDGTGLNNIKSQKRDISAKVLVFPHHGGQPANANIATFTKELCALVEPSAVIFSISRDRFSNPHPTIVRTIKSTCPEAHIVCTQLSKHCAESLPKVKPTHLSDKPAKGKQKNQSCGGTLLLGPRAGTPVNKPKTAEHLKFIARHAPSALCQHNKKKQ